MMMVGVYLDPQWAHEDGEEDDVISLLVHDGELYHLENEPFTWYFHDNC